VLARGSPGITLFKADRLLGQHTLQVHLLAIVLCVSFQQASAQKYPPH